MLFYVVCLLYGFGRFLEKNNIDKYKKAVLILIKRLPLRSFEKHPYINNKYL